MEATLKPEKLCTAGLMHLTGAGISRALCSRIDHRSPKRPSHSSVADSHLPTAIPVLRLPPNNQVSKIFTGIKVCKVKYNKDWQNMEIPEILWLILDSLT